MKTNFRMTAKFFRDVLPGDLIAFQAGIEPGLAVVLKRPNYWGFEAVALALNSSSMAPCPIAGQIEGDNTVLLIEDVVISADRRMKSIGLGRIATGCVGFTTKGHFLRCEHNGTPYDVNLETGEISSASSLPFFWTSSWKMSDPDGDVVFEWPPKSP